MFSFYGSSTHSYNSIKQISRGFSDYHSLEKPPVFYIFEPPHLYQILFLHIRIHACILPVITLLNVFCVVGNLCLNILQRLRKAPERDLIFYQYIYGAKAICTLTTNQSETIAFTPNKKCTLRNNRGCIVSKLESLATLKYLL